VLETPGFSYLEVGELSYEPEGRVQEGEFRLHFVNLRITQNGIGTVVLILCYKFFLKNKSVIVQARFECAPRAGFTKKPRRMCYVFSAQINSGLAQCPRSARLILEPCQTAVY
jgi:hypothetical protein